MPALPATASKIDRYVRQRADGLGVGAYGLLHDDLVSLPRPWQKSPNTSVESTPFVSSQLFIHWDYGSYNGRPSFKC